MIVKKPLGFRLNVMVTKIGRFEDSLAPFKAHIASPRSYWVSINRKSTPPSVKALACTAYADINSSSVESPSGLRNLPVGPMLPATNFPSGLASTASFAAAIFNS